MKGKNALIIAGVIIYIAMSGIDRFVISIPNIIYIPIAVLGIVLILTGAFSKKGTAFSRSFSILRLKLTHPEPQEVWG